MQPVLSRTSLPNRRVQELTRSHVYRVCVGQLLILAALLMQPRLLPLAAAACLVAYWQSWGLEAALLIALIQVGITAGYEAERSVALFSIAGLAFTVVDVLAIFSVAAGLRRFNAILRSGPILRRLLLSLLAFEAYLSVPLVITWARHSDSMPIAVRNMRGYLYVLLIVLFVAVVIARRDSAPRLLISLNLASASVALAQIAQALHWVQVTGYQTRLLTLTTVQQTRLLILPETLAPALLAAALTAALFRSGAERRAGLLAFYLLLGGLITSPGRGAIFSSVVIAISVLTIYVRKAMSSRVPQGDRAPIGRLVLMSLVAATATIAIVAGIAKSSESRSVLASRFQQGIAPWSTSQIVGRSNGWRAGLQMARRQPLFGDGLGTRFPELVQRFQLDSDYNFPGSFPNLLAKTGFVGLFLFSSILWTIGSRTWRNWRRRGDQLSLVAFAIVLALVVRSLSDDVFQGFQFPILIGIAAALLTQGGSQTDPGSLVS